MPSENFLFDYLLYNSGNECPLCYHVWTAMAVVASAVGPKVYFDFQYSKIFCNPYVILVGEQGNGKTFAKDIGIDMLKRACPGIPISAECTSKESIVQTMSEDEQARQFTITDPAMLKAFGTTNNQVEYRPFSIFITELKNFVSVNPAGMLDFLTTIYDRTGATYDSRYRNKGEFTLVNPYVVFLACETPEWLTYRLKESVISGGFSRRCFFVYEITDKLFTELPICTDDMRAAFARCIKHLEQVKSLVGVLTFDEGAEVYFTKWSKSRRLPPDTIIRGYIRSKHIQVIKVASLLALCEYPPTRRISISHVEMALDLLGRLEPNMYRLFQGVGQNPLVHASTLMLNIVDASGGMVRERECKSAMWTAARDIDYHQIKKHLADSGKLFFSKDDKGVDWVLTKAKAEALAQAGRIQK